MKRSILLSVMAILATFAASAQAVSKRVVVEHFTNSYCSICASRNPGFYNNLWSFPQVLHLAIHPSAPYSSCPINQHNKLDNDARTNFYGIYGATPRIVIQGKVIPSSANYGDATLFQNELNQTTPFDVQVSISPVSFTDAEVKIVVKKVDASTIANLQLFGAIVQDTLFFNANNGETTHYDVFRKAVWNTPVAVTAPANIGDSVIHTQVVVMNAAWPNVYAMAILSDAANKEVVQAAKSGTIPVTTSVNNIAAQSSIRIYPNPVMDRIYIEAADDIQSYMVTDIKGVVAAQGGPIQKSVDVSYLQAGMYFLKLTGKSGMSVTKFIKQ